MKNWIKLSNKTWDYRISLPGSLSRLCLSFCGFRGCLQANNIFSAGRGHGKHSKYKLMAHRWFRESCTNYQNPIMYEKKISPHIILFKPSNFKPNLKWFVKVWVSNGITIFSSPWYLKWGVKVHLSKFFWGQLAANNTCMRGHKDTDATHRHWETFPFVFKLENLNSV